MNDTKILLLPALLAAGSGLTPAPAAALQLADIKVHSTLGQPLRASIAYALNPNEQIADECVSLQSALQHGGVPAVRNARVSVANGLIRLTGTSPVSEPIVALRVNIRCPYTPRLSRDFTLFIDPAGTPEPAVAPVSVAAARRAPPEVPSRPAAVPLRTSPAGAVDPGREVAGDRYLVQPGDSLSAIAGRLRDRQVGLWAAAVRIHAANPHAFIDNDPNRLRAGSWLRIPAFGPGDSLVPLGALAEPAATRARQAPAPAAADPAAASPSAVAAPAVEAGAVAAATPDRVMPGMEVGGAGAAAPRESRELLDETFALPGGVSPNVPIARIAPANTDAASSVPGTLWWLVAGGIALFAGLLALIRRSATPVSPVPQDSADSQPLRRAMDTARVEAVVAEDYSLSDDSPTAENLVLDADLELGTGLAGGTDIAVTEDFGFSTSAELDLELPAQTESSESGATGKLRQTDIIATPQREPDSILESEILPEDDDYDMSVVMDVTKMPDTDAVTERDLKAVVVDDEVLAHREDHYTISQEAEYQILEQDYEEELSATQALNLEIERAAAELAERLDAEIVAAHEGAANEDAPGEEVTPTGEQTALLPLASVTRLDPPSRPADGAALDGLRASNDAGISHEDMTAELPAPKDSKAS